jgi:hypothetical protein
MARTSWSTSNYLTGDPPGANGRPFTFAAWAKVTDSTPSSRLTIINRNSDDSSQSYYFLGLSTSGKVEAQIIDFNNHALTATSTSTVSAGTWFHAAATFPNSGDVTVYLNGGSSNSVSGRFDGFNSIVNFGIGIFPHGVTRAEPFENSGAIAEVAMWGVILSNNELSMHAAGTPALYIQPQNLLGYWPLIGNRSVEPNLVGPEIMTMSGTLTEAAHPPVSLIKRHRLR